MNNAKSQKVNKIYKYNAKFTKCEGRSKKCEMLSLIISEDAYHFMSAVRYSNQIIDVLKPQNITSTHVTVSVPGTSKFLLLKTQNWFTSKICGQVMLFYIKKVHRLHVFLQPRNVDPREVCFCVNFSPYFG